ncbi:prepilin peptidase [archaeon]|nr:prepilin peptidase [archaeon]
MLTILLILCFVFLFLASAFDIRTHEIPDWLNYGIIILALLYRLIWSLVAWNNSFLLEGLFGLGIALAIACFLFYTGQWGGGDAKSLMGVGALLGFNLSLNHNFSGFLVNLIFAGATYSVFCILFIALNNWKKISKEYNKKVSNYLFKFMIVSFVILIFLLLIRINVDLKIFLTGAYIAGWSLYLLTILVKSVEQAYMIRLVSPSKLTEGDWIAKEVRYKGKTIASPKDLGLSIEQINKLKKINKKILVKYGIPFLPSFLISFIVTLLAGNLLSYIL